MAVLDWRYRLAMFDRPKVTLMTLAVMIGFFLIWDIAGIALGIWSANPRYLAGINLGHPDLPLEELVFLALISYTTLLLARWRNVT